MNIENLKKLSNYFLSLNPENFDLKKVMYIGFNNDYFYFRDFIKQNNIKLLENEIGKVINDIVFIIWIENFTGLKYVKDQNAYEWLFDYSWKNFNKLSIDPTPQGISRRIDYLIKNGVPSDYKLQYQGDVDYFCSE